MEDVSFTVWAHRGDSAHCPENTLTSVRRALKLGARAIELDVQLTKDGEVVVLHDFNLDRTTDGTGWVGNLTLDDLRNLDAGSWFSPAFAGERIPTLEEVLAVLPDHCLLNIELKTAPRLYPGLEERVLHLIRYWNRMESTIVSSFDHDALLRFQRLDSALPVAVLIDGALVDLFGYLERSELRAQNIHANEWYVTPEFIEEAHLRGYAVHVYTVESADRLHTLRTWGVDGVFLNDITMVSG